MNNTVTFDVAKHLYKRGETPLISVTQLLKKHGLAPDYGAVPADVLERKAALGTAIHAEIENYIKTGEIPDAFTAQGLKEAREILRVDSLSEEDRKVYKRYLQGVSLALSLDDSSRYEGYCDGHLDGLAEGIKARSFR